MSRSCSDVSDLRKGINIMKSSDRAAEKAPRRSGKRFNALDALIIIIIIAVLAVTLLAYLPGGILRLPEKNNVTVTYTIEVKGVKRELAAGIAVDDPVTEKGTSVSLGNISAEVEVTPYSTVRYDAASGEVVTDEYSGLSTLLITVTAQAGYDSSRGYTVNGRRIAIGAEYGISLPGFEGTGSCISITETGGSK